MPSFISHNDDAAEGMDQFAREPNAIHTPENIKRLRECGCGGDVATEAATYGTVNPSLQAAVKTKKMKAKTKPPFGKKKKKLTEAVKNDIKKGEIRKKKAKTQFSKVKTSSGSYKKGPISGGRTGGIS